MKIQITILLALFVSCAKSKDHKNDNHHSKSGDQTKEAQKDFEEEPAFDPNRFPIVVLGDSISAAMLAPSKIGEALPETVLANLLNYFTDDPSDLTKFLDGSLTVDIDDIGERVSWKNTLGAFSGIKSWSHRKRLQKLGKEVSTYNLAVIGARVADAQKQISQIAAKYKEGLRNDGYVVFEFGANDFCQETDINIFAVSTQERLQKVLDLHKKAVVAVVAIPNIPQLFSLTTDGELASTLEGDMVEELFGSSKSLSCGQVRDAFAACPVMKNLVVDKAQRLSDMNAALAEIVSKVNKNGNRLVFANAVGTANFTREHIAGDCFHPSEKGQEFLSELVWKAVKGQF